MQKLCRNAINKKTSKVRKSLPTGSNTESSNSKIDDSKAGNIVIYFSYQWLANKSNYKDSYDPDSTMRSDYADSVVGKRLLKSNQGVQSDDYIRKEGRYVYKMLKLNHTQLQNRVLKEHKEFKYDHKNERNIIPALIYDNGYQSTYDSDSDRKISCHRKDSVVLKVRQTK